MMNHRNRARRNVENENEVFAGLVGMILISSFLLGLAESIGKRHFGLSYCGRFLALGLHGFAIQSKTPRRSDSFVKLKTTKRNLFTAIASP